MGQVSGETVVFRAWWQSQDGKTWQGMLHIDRNRMAHAPISSGWLRGNPPAFSWGPSHGPTGCVTTPTFRQCLVLGQGTLLLQVLQVLFFFFFLNLVSKLSLFQRPFLQWFSEVVSQVGFLFFQRLQQNSHESPEVLSPSLSTQPSTTMTFAKTREPTLFLPKPKRAFRPEPCASPICASSPASALWSALSARSWTLTSKRPWRIVSAPPSDWSTSLSWGEPCPRRLRSFFFGGLYTRGHYSDGR